MNYSIAWCAGYYNGYKPHGGRGGDIIPPDDYTDEERNDFASGFFVGVGDAIDRALIDAIDQAFD